MPQLTRRTLLKMTGIAAATAATATATGLSWKHVPALLQLVRQWDVFPNTTQSDQELFPDLPPSDQQPFLTPTQPEAEPLSATAHAVAWNHNPWSQIGPAHWDDIGYPVCGQSVGPRKGESPIDIRSSRVVTYRGSPVRLRYTSSEHAVENTGHVVEVPMPTSVHNTLYIGRTSFKLVQYHFHAPSEHTINGQWADAEAHFVHMDAHGMTAVVAILFNIVGPYANGLIDRLLLAAPATSGHEVHAGTASPAEFFHYLRGVSVRRGGGIQVNAFYAYTGSLTTPGCTGNVRWLVLPHPGNVSLYAVSHLHDVIAQFPHYNGYPNNNRPRQPLNGRVIRFRRG